MDKEISILESIKRRQKAEGSQLATNCTQLKLLAIKKMYEKF
jgi:hypothetical protein